MRYSLTALIFLCLFFECTRTQETPTTELWTTDENDSGNDERTSTSISEKWISEIFDEVTELWTTNENDSENDERMSTSSSKKWISEIFDEVQDNFRMYADVSERCRRDYMMYETHLRNQTIWAIRMMESTEWPRLGLFAGETTVFGGWSECLGVRSPTYQGQYCLVDAFYDYSFAEADPIRRGWDKPANQNSSVWGVIKMYDKIITRKSRHNLTWAMCIPSSCTPDDLSTSVRNVASPIFQKYNINFVVNVLPNTCRVQESKPLSTAFLYTLFLLLFISAVVLLATYRDYKVHIGPNSKKPSEDSYSEKVLYSFSLLQSWKCLTNETPNTIHSLYFAKSIMFSLIVIAHEGLLAIPHPKIEQEDTEMLYQPWEITFWIHSIVDLFIGISGYITFHFGYEQTKRNGISYFFGAIICRWARLMPVMGLFILVYVFMGSELGDGPLWTRRMTYDVDCCRANWWINMLAIQNLVNRKDICLTHSWCLAVDFQLTIVGTFILVILAKNFTLGIVFMVLTFVAGIGSHFYKIYANEFSGLPAPTIYELAEFRHKPFFSDLYIQAYSRTGPYMVGFGGALLQKVLNNRKYSPSIPTSWLIFLTALLIGIGPQQYGFMLAILGRPYNAIENAVYGSITRTLTAVPLITGVILVSLRGMGWFSYVLKWKIFLILGRLAYVVYLSSFSIQFFRYSSMRQLLIASDYVHVLYGVMTDTVLTGIVSGLLFALAEGPLHNLMVLVQTIFNEKAKREYENRPSETIKQRPYDDV